MELVKIEDVHYRYPTSKKDILDGLSLTLEQGKVYALIGENGGGKSTICNLIRGFVPHIFKGELSGQATVLGEDVTEADLSEFAQKIGYVAQNPFTQITGATETVFEEIGYGLESLGLQREEIFSQINRVLELFGIENLAEKNPTELSGGQKQKVALASVFAMDPELFIIDEPTSQLDPVGTRDIFDIVAKLKEANKTVLLVENKIELVAEYADYIYLIKDGKVFDSGTGKELLTKSSTEENGSFIPQYTKLAQKLIESGVSLDELPVLKDETVAMIQQILARKGVSS